MAGCTNKNIGFSNSIMKKIEKIKTTLTDHKNEFAEKYGVKSLGVFGSFVRDEQRENSDIDILVEFNHPIGLEFVDLADELEKLLMKKVDLVSRGAIKPNMWKLIEKDLVYV